ncbi:MAG TPA: NAD(P)/FAD-dependent oxidoreductase [Solirubrobacterales bacterium]|nr:NAD(P)/FAD-dependent oxidoreductase [Solirubrobacterales bacterium]
MRVAVLGAGMAGLSAAYRLGTLGHEAVIYERWPGLGGQAATIDVGDGVLVERYYHHLFTSDRHIADLCDEIGLDDELAVWPSSIGMFYGGRLYPFTSPLDLLRYKPMSLPARVRMGFAVLMLQRRANEVEPFEPLTIKDWVERKMGRQAWETIWGPMLRGKFGDKADRISMSWLWAKLRNRRQTSGDEAREEKLVYPRHSFEAIFKRLEERIAEQGGRVLIDCPAAQVTRAPDGGFLVHAGAPDSFRRGHDPREFERAGEPERYDAVVATLPTDIFEQVLGPSLRAEVGDAWFERANSIEYFEALCLLVELDRQFHPYYWTNVADEDMRFIGLIEQTNLVGPEHYGGRRFLYVANYLPRRHELLSLDIEELWDVYEPGLRKVNPQFTRDWVVQSWRFREPAAQPVVLPNHPQRMPPYETGVPGLLMANTTQVYPDDRGTNYAVREADEVVEALLAQGDRLEAPAAA